MIMPAGILELNDPYGRCIFSVASTNLLFEAWTNTLLFSMEPVQDIASAWFEGSCGRSDEE